MRPLSFVLTIALAATLGGSALAGGPPQVGQPAPGFTAPLASGGNLSLSSLRGKAVYLNFFASWCPPCNEEAPDVNALQKKYAKRGLVVVGVDELENAAKANGFLKKYGLVYKAVVDSGTLRDEYGTNALPVHVFISRNGKVKLYREGEMSKTEIESAIKSIL
ncbi:MAG: TlpA family protein disulfide reductase [Candidatus Eremiobacteraeota bacterium]|nr:TlpA family protein disulfide reductase [Candidatus Eremiobacteraeota bacterium]